MENLVYKKWTDMTVKAQVQQNSNMRVLNCLECEHMVEFNRWFEDAPLVTCDYKKNTKGNGTFKN